MSLTHATATRNALADKITTLLGATGKLRFRASTTTIVDISLANPAFGAASGGTATLAGTPLSANAVATGSIDNFQLLDSSGTLLLSGTVTATGGGGDITVNNISVNSGQEVAISSLTYSASA